MLTLITGASSGLGAEMARQLADRGHDLVLTARRVDRLERLKAEILAVQPALRVEVAGLDVIDQDAVFDVFRRYAPLERVIVNAGLGGTKVVGSGGHEHNRAVAMTNFVGALAQVEAAMEQFRANGRGHLVVISSFSAMRPARRARRLRRKQARAGAPRRRTALRDALREPADHRHDCLRGVHPLGDDRRSDRRTVHRRYADWVRAIVAGIEAGKATVFAPRLPWEPLGLALRVLPLRIVSRITRPARGE